MRDIRSVALAAMVVLAIFFVSPQVTSPRSPHGAAQNFPSTVLFEYLKGPGLTGL